MELGERLILIKWDKYISHIVDKKNKKDEVFVYYFFSQYKETGYFTGLRPNAVYQARLFDPIVGKFIDIDDITATSEGTYSVPSFPSKRDWVLLLNLKEIDFGPYESCTYPDIHRPIAASEAIIDEELEIAELKVSSEDEDFPAKNLLDNRVMGCFSVGYMIGAHKTNDRHSG